MRERSDAREDKQGKKDGENDAKWGVVPSLLPLQTLQPVLMCPLMARQKEQAGRQETGPILVNGRQLHCSWAGPIPVPANIHTLTQRDKVDVVRHRQRVNLKVERR